MKEVKVMINGEETTISYNTYQRIKDIAKSRKLTMAGAISYCLQKDPKENRMKPEDIMTDEQVAKLLHLSTEVFQRKCRDGFAAGEIDLLAAQPITLGKSRRWFREEVERVLRKKITVAPKAEQAETKEVVNG